MQISVHVISDNIELSIVVDIAWQYEIVNIDNL